MATRAPKPAENIATHIKRYTSTAQILKKAAGIGIGEFGGTLYTNLNGTVQTLKDALENAQNIVNVGTLSSNGGTVTVSEVGNGISHQTTFTLTNVPLTLINADGLNGLGSKIYTFPTGLITVQSASGSVTEKTTSVLASTLNASVTYNWGLGHTTQVNATLATTEQDIIPTTNGSASATINVAGAASSGVRAAAPANFDGRSVAIPVYFNVGVATDSDIDGNATTLWTGVLSITWTFGGTV